MNKTAKILLVVFAALVPLHSLVAMQSAASIRQYLATAIPAMRRAVQDNPGGAALALAAAMAASGYAASRFFRQRHTPPKPSLSPVSPTVPSGVAPVAPVVYSVPALSASGGRWDGDLPQFVRPNPRPVAASAVVVSVSSSSSVSASSSSTLPSRSSFDPSSVIKHGFSGIFKGKAGDGLGFVPVLPGGLGDYPELLDDSKRAMAAPVVDEPLLDTITGVTVVIPQPGDDGASSSGDGAGGRESKEPTVVIPSAVVVAGAGAVVPGEGSSGSGDGAGEKESKEPIDVIPSVAVVAGAGAVVPGAESSDSDGEEEYDIPSQQEIKQVTKAEKLVSLADRYKEVRENSKELKHFLCAYYPTMQRLWNDLSSEERKPIAHIQDTLHLMMNEYARGPWMLGQEIMHAITACGAQETVDARKAAYAALVEQYGSRKAYLHSFVALRWYFYMLAAMQGKVYTEATFQLRDSHDILARFQTHITKQQEKDRSEVRLEPVDQRRVSSHRKDIAGEERGNDIPERFQGDPRYELPNGAKHSFYKLLDTSFLLDKPESDGTTNKKSFIVHGLGVPGSIARGALGGNEVASYYKERYPAKVKKMLRNYLNLALRGDIAVAVPSLTLAAVVTVVRGVVGKAVQKSIGNTKADRIVAYLKEAETKPLLHVHVIIDRAKRQYMIDHNLWGDDELPADLQASIASLRAEVDNYDHIADGRTGREIFLDTDDFTRGDAFHDRVRSALKLPSSSSSSSPAAGAGAGVAAA